MPNKPPQQQQQQQQHHQQHPTFNLKKNSNNTHSFQLSSKKRHKQLAYGQNYVPEEETIRNDNSLHYVLTGSRPQNQIQNTAISTRFAEYPKLKKLLELKKSQVSQYSHPPIYIQADLRPSPYPNSFDLLQLLPTRFDVIVLDPPLQEYIQRYPHLTQTHPNLLKSGGPLHQERPYWNWDELENLPIPSIAASPGFIFLWCGSGQGSTLESGRALLSKWGYRKCEDLVWIKTNHHSTQNLTQIDDQQSNPTPILPDQTPPPPPAVFTSTKEHCLMGIRGTVRRSTDGHFVHCNVDTDVIVAEPDPTDVLHKPEELYQLIENFCLGRRRLDLFGSRKTLRPGWLTIGNECEPTPSSETPQDSVELSQLQSPIPYEKSKYLNYFLDESRRTQNLLPTNADIDNLRPRSPPSRIAPAIASTGIALPHGRGFLPGTMPMIGPDGCIIGNTISGRNTISHPSGGLGRGPGNALLPGMRVSGSRDSNHSSNSNHSRAINQMGYHPPSLNLPTTFNPNLTPAQLTSTSYPFNQSIQPFHPTAWSHQPMHYGLPATTPLNHQQVSATTHTSFPNLLHLPPPHTSFYHQTPSFFPTPPVHHLQPYNPYIPLPDPHHQHHPQLPSPHVAYSNHHHSLAQHSFPLRHLHTPRDDSSRFTFSPNTYSNLNPTSNTFPFNSSPSLSPLSPAAPTSNTSPSSNLYTQQPNSS